MGTVLATVLGATFSHLSSGLPLIVTFVPGLYGGTPYPGSLFVTFVQRPGVLAGGPGAVECTGAGMAA